MKIKTFGCKDMTCQLPRIEEAFKKLGHEIVEENNTNCCDLVYSNDAGGYEAALDYVGIYCLACPKIIFNVLDIPEHLFPNYDLDKLKKQLSQANQITCISKTVQAQIKKFLNLNATVIYNPAKNITPLKEKLEDRFKYLYVGRANDPNKRFELVRQMCYSYNLLDFLVVCGSENPNTENYLGVVSDKRLNYLYNSIDFVLLPSKFEGIGLPMIEAILAGKFPIVCEDNPTAMEFCPEFATEPTADGLYSMILHVEANQDYYKKVVEKYQKDFKKKFSKTEVAKRILELIKHEN